MLRMQLRHYLNVTQKACQRTIYHHITARRMQDICLKQATDNRQDTFTTVDIYDTGKVLHAPFDKRKVV